MVSMHEMKQVDGRLLTLNWPSLATEVTLSDDTSQLQEAKAEIEDTEGVIHLVNVLVRWDADYLVGKEVTLKPSDSGTLLVEK